eukprot:SAG25_NODE_272_length_10613_cov_6.416191_16_plen_101_part_00
MGISVTVLVLIMMIKVQPQRPAPPCHKRPAIEAPWVSKTLAVAGGWRARRLDHSKNAPPNAFFGPLSTEMTVGVVRTVAAAAAHPPPPRRRRPWARRRRP